MRRKRAYPIFKDTRVRSAERTALRRLLYNVRVPLDHFPFWTCETSTFVLLYFQAGATAPPVSLWLFLPAHPAPSRTLPVLPPCLPAFVPLFRH
jgi:hypothetical protein